jgi:hypothetical protein
MRITSILRIGTLALALTAAGSAVGPAFAAPAGDASSQQSQLSNSGPYDGAADEAAKRSYK